MTVTSLCPNRFDTTWTGTLASGGNRERDVVASSGNDDDDDDDSGDDRFAIIRMREDNKRRRESGEMSSSNQGDEVQMRKELGATAIALFKRLETRVSATPALQMPSRESQKLLSVVDVVTRARSGVEYSRSGADVIYSHAPEAPTRLLKHLFQLSQTYVRQSDRLAATFVHQAL